MADLFGSLSPGDWFRFVSAIAAFGSLVLGVVTLVRVVRAERATTKPNLYPTEIYLNPWEVGNKEDLRAVAKREGQKNPVIHRRRLKDGSRDVTSWALHSKKVGDRLRLRGQVDLRNGGMGDGRLVMLEQHFFWEGRPLSTPPVAKEIEFVVRPQQTFNVDFEVDVPDNEIGEGVLVYAFRCTYADLRGRPFEEKVLWWYEGKTDKWWNNMNKVPAHDHIRKQLPWRL